jgi:organic radical activating enzyme
VHIHTTGRSPPDGGADWTTVSPKPPDYEVHPGFVRLSREVKLVVCRELTLDALRKVRAVFPDSTPILLQPQSNAGWSRRKAMALFEGARRSGLVGIRLSVQLHKIYGLR